MSTKDCPSCGAEVPASATRCKECFHDFTEDGRRGFSFLGPLIALGALAGMALIGALVLLVIFMQPVEHHTLVDESTRSIVWTTTPDHARQLMEADDARLASEVFNAIGGVLGDVRAAGPRGQFPLRLAHAKAYTRQRFVLAGDAAHAVHPLAGQGVNLGFLDCAALIETLADELEAGSRVSALGESRVLRRYERWRKSENTIALGLIDGLNRLFSNSSEALGSIRRTGLSAVGGSALAKRFLIGRAMGIAGDAPRLTKRLG